MAKDYRPGGTHAPGKAPEAYPGTACDPSRGGAGNGTHNFNQDGPSKGAGGHGSSGSK